MPSYGRNTFWTAERDAELIARYRRGDSYYTIADAWGKDPTAVYNRVCRLGLRDRAGALSLEQVCDRAAELAATRGGHTA